MDDSSELLDVVDSEDNVIGTMVRGNVGDLFKTTGRYIRYANCFLLNTEGTLWIPRRVSTKKIAPGGLDFAASEHVQSGEEYLEAIVRGLKEELDITIDKTAVTQLGKLSPTIDRPYFSMIYLLIQNEAPGYNPADFTGFEWLAPRQLHDRLTTTEVAKQDLLPALELYLDSSTMPGRVN